MLIIIKRFKVLYVYDLPINKISHNNARQLAILVINSKVL